MPLSTRSSIVVLLVLVLSAPLPAPLPAQLPALDGLPTHAPINPSSVRRTGLFMAPYVMPRAGWRVGLSLDYGNAIEAAPKPLPVAFHELACPASVFRESEKNDEHGA